MYSYIHFRLYTPINISKQSKWSIVEEWVRICDTQALEYHSAITWDLLFCYNMNGSGGDHVKRNEPAVKRWILNDLAYVGFKNNMKFHVKH